MECYKCEKKDKCYEIMETSDFNIWMGMSVWVCKLCKEAIEIREKELGKKRNIYIKKKKEKRISKWLKYRRKLIGK